MKEPRVKCKNCKKDYPLNFYPTKQKNYKVYRLQVCKECCKK